MVAGIVPRMWALSCSELLRWGLRRRLGDNFPVRRFPCGERVWLRACSVGEGSVALQVTSGGARERRLGFAPDIA